MITTTATGIATGTSQGGAIRESGIVLIFFLRYDSSISISIMRLLTYSTAIAAAVVHHLYAIHIIIIIISSCYCVTLTNQPTDRCYLLLLLVLLLLAVSN